jgi:hypothetical protein
MRSRIGAWIDRQYPRERSVPDFPLAIAAGCKTRQGIVVDAHAERGPRTKDPLATIRRTFVLRVSPGQIEKLAEKQAEGSDRAMEWSDEGSVETLALVDLDGDGVQDVVIDHLEHEGGAIHSGYTIEVLRSRNAARVQVASFYGDLSVVGNPTGPLVLAVGSTDVNHEYACLGDDLKLARCPAAEVARLASKRLEIADRYARLQASEVPDRDLLADELGILGVAAAERAPLLAAAIATTAGQRAEREVARFVAQTEGTDPLRALLQPEAPRTVAQAYFAELRSELGDVRCIAPKLSPATKARAVAWVRAHTVELDRESGQCPATGPCAREAPAAIAVTPACGPYFWVAWDDSSKAHTTDGEQHHIVLFGDAMTRLVTHADQGTFDPQVPAATVLDAVFFHHGDAVVGTILVDEKSAVVVSDSKVVETRQGGFTRYLFSRSWSDTSDDLVHEPSSATVWHPTVTGLQRVVSPAVVAHETRRDALDQLASFEARFITDAASRDRYVAALETLGADHALVTLVKSVP